MKVGSCARGSPIANDAQREAVDTKVMELEPSSMKLVEWCTYHCC